MSKVISISLLCIILALPLFLTVQGINVYTENSYAFLFGWYYVMFYSLSYIYSWIRLKFFKQESDAHDTKTNTILFLISLINIFLLIYTCTL